MLGVDHDPRGLRRNFGRRVDSPFEEDVAQALMSMGYKVDLQVEVAGFRIDIGIRHPERENQYVLAVECDGATYHGGVQARSRDRNRQEILEGIGWRFHRVWSTEWFNKRDEQIEMLRYMINLAVEISDRSRIISEVPFPVSNPLYLEQSPS